MKIKQKKRMTMEILQINSGKHHKGNCRCDECWQGYPVKCTCGGLIHAEYLGDAGKTSANPMGVKCLCDKCGSRFLKAAYKNYGRKNRAHNNRRNY